MDLASIPAIPYFTQKLFAVVLIAKLMTAVQHKVTTYFVFGFVMSTFFVFTPVNTPQEVMNIIAIELYMIFMAHCL